MNSRFPRRFHRATLAAPLLGILGLMAPVALQGQSLFFEDFEGLTLGPNVDEGLAGLAVWTASPPPNWISDSSQVPGVGTDLDGVTEWAGWGFANKDWWVQTAGNQRRVEWVLGTGTVMIADPDEWDDAAHVQGLFNIFVSTPEITFPAAPADSLVLAFDSSWRPEAFDDGAPSFPEGPEGQRINNQTVVIRSIFAAGTTNEVVRWDSDANSPFYKADSDFINESVLVPLNNPAGATSLKLNFGMELAANDWWWAVDNITVGTPPLLVGLVANGVQFTGRIAEGLGKTVDQSKGITVTLDGAAVTPGAISQEGSVLTVPYSQAPAIWIPKSVHTVKFSYTSNEGKLIEETRSFTAPGYSAVRPTPTTVAVTLTEPDYFTIAEGQGIQLKLDGTLLTGSSPVRAEKVLTLRAPTGSVLAPGSAHVLEVIFRSTDGTEVVDAVAFTAPAFQTLPASLATAAGTGVQPGMLWRVHQIATNRPTTIAAALAQLAGDLGPSIANPSTEADGLYRIEFVNFEQAASDAGNFKSAAELPALQVLDAEIPGIPGLEGGNDNIAAEAWTFIEIPQAGLYTMVVNSDDGFQVTAGTTNQPAALVLGSFDAGRGESDSEFYFQVTQPGVYFLKLLFFEGGSGASVEWFTINADGSYALVNGVQTGALKAFRARTVPEPEIGGGIESVSLNDGQVVLTYTGTLKSAGTLGGPYETVAGATSPYTVTPPASGGQQFFRAE
ncbi:MAG: hypothetical protein J0L84_02290 [Verrucomicrobia bacterium]|nr:hypothetical protein [Verrucomicrobiota bacterium]